MTPHDVPSRGLALVTGAAGFIANHITRGLLRDGWRVRAFDDLSGGMGWSRLDDLGGAVERVEGSITGPAGRLREAVFGADLVVHHAALISVPESLERPEDYHHVNATGTLRVLEAARASGVGRLVYASTSAVYGDDPEQPKREAMVPCPVSPYAVSKYAGERYVSAYARLYGMATVSLRYFNVFGEGQNLTGQYGAAIPAIVTRIMRDAPPTIYGDGAQTRDFCHVSNVVAANVLAAAAPADALRGDVVNVGTGRRVSINDLVAMANRLLDRSVAPVYAPARAGDVRDSLADVARARAVLGYAPDVDLEEGLRRAIAGYRRAVPPEAASARYARLC